jgi:multidrug transporter EmrE-like cation transporter
MVVAGGAALMAVVGIGIFREPASVTRVVGIVLAIVAMVLLRK